MIVRSEEACLDILTGTLSLLRNVLIVNFNLSHGLNIRYIVTERLSSSKFPGTLIAGVSHSNHSVFRLIIYLLLQKTL